MNALVLNKKTGVNALMLLTKTRVNALMWARAPISSGSTAASNRWCSTSRATTTRLCSRPCSPRPTCSCRTSSPAPSPSSAFPLDQLRRTHPRLVICSISGYGEDGPYAARKAYDMLIQAESGLASLTGSPDAPARVGVSVCDIAAGMNAYEAILEALIARGRTGDGAAISISMFDAMADWMAVPLLQYEGGQPPRRMGLAHTSIAPYGVFKTSGRRRHSDLDPERPRMARAGRAGARRQRARRRSRLRHQCRARQAPRRHRRARAAGVRRHRRCAAHAEARRRRHRLCPRQRHRRPRRPSAAAPHRGRDARRARCPIPRRPRAATAPLAATARCPRSASTAPRSAPSSCRPRSVPVRASEATPGATNSVDSPPPCGEGLGVGVVVVALRMSSSTYRHRSRFAQSRGMSPVDMSSCRYDDPHPQPLPTRGRGADRVCGTFSRDSNNRGSPHPRRSPSPHLASALRCLVER